MYMKLYEAMWQYLDTYYGIWMYMKVYSGIRIKMVVNKLHMKAYECISANMIVYESIL